jgi:hypothetical protein
MEAGETPLTIVLISNQQILYFDSWRGKGKTNW